MEAGTRPAPGAAAPPATPRAPTRPARPAAASRLRVLASDYVAMTKPKVQSLLLFTTVATMYVAGDPSLGLVALTCLGGALSAGGAGAINHWYDRDIDAVMRRTSDRPVPSGRVSPRAALVYGIVLGTTSFALLALTVNLLAAALALAGLLGYVLVYTVWLKRATPQNIVIGGAAGAVPPLVAWAAVTGSLEGSALYLFAIVFYWTPPHFWALSLLMREEYERANVPMLPVVRGEAETRWQIVLYTVLLARGDAASFRGHAVRRRISRPWRSSRRGVPVAGATAAAPRRPALRTAPVPRSRWRTSRFVRRDGPRRPRVSGGWATTARQVVTGDGYAVGHIDELGEGYGFRKVRRELGVKALGMNAIVIPPGYATGRHYHEEQEEVYFVHRGRIAMEFGGRVDARARPRRRCARGRRDGPHGPQRGRRRRRVRGGGREGRLRRPGRAPARGRDQPLRRLGAGGRLERRSGAWARVGYDAANAARSVERRDAATIAPAVAPATAAAIAAPEPEASIRPPARAAPPAIPATSAVSGHVSASVSVPGGATELASSFRLAMIGAMKAPAGSRRSAMIDIDGASRSGTSASGRRSVSLRWICASGRSPCARAVDEPASHAAQRPDRQQHAGQLGARTLVAEGRQRHLERPDREPDRQHRGRERADPRLAERSQHPRIVLAPASRAQLGRQRPEEDRDADQHRRRRDHQRRCGVDQRHDHRHDQRRAHEHDLEQDGVERVRRRYELGSLSEQCGEARAHGRRRGREERAGGNRQRHQHHRRRAGRTGRDQAHEPCGVAAGERRQHPHALAVDEASHQGRARAYAERQAAGHDAGDRERSGLGAQEEDDRQSVDADG